MSAKGRGAEVIPNEVYPTPRWCTDRVLEALRSEYEFREPEHGLWRILEPCAGEGAIVRALRDACPQALITASDVRDCRAAQKAAGATFTYHEDALSAPESEIVRNNYHLAITNPPFSLADQIVQRMLLAAEWVVILTRQAFVGHERAAWMRGNMPDTFELPDRPSFASKETCVDKACNWKGRLVQHNTPAAGCPACGGPSRVRPTTDAADYCWIVWTPERGRNSGRRMILPATPLAERKAA